jgi:hypothetical protein
MSERLTWLRRECGDGKTCAGAARHTKLPGGTIYQGYTITDPEVLADLGLPPKAEGYLFVPDDMPEV